MCDEGGKCEGGGMTSASAISRILNANLPEIQGRVTVTELGNGQPIIVLTDHDVSREYAYWWRRIAASLPPKYYLRAYSSGMIVCEHGVPQGRAPKRWQRWGSRMMGYRGTELSDPQVIRCGNG